MIEGWITREDAWEQIEAMLEVAIQASQAFKHIPPADIDVLKAHTGDLQRLAAESRGKPSADLMAISLLKALTIGGMIGAENKSFRRGEESRERYDATLGAINEEKVEVAKKDHVEVYSLFDELSKTIPSKKRRYYEISLRTKYTEGYVKNLINRRNK